MKGITAIYPGTFDPITNGHRDVAQRAMHLFDRVILAVAEGKHKTPLFDVEERVRLASKVMQDHPSVEVCAFDCLAVEFAQREQASVIIRGLRALSDFEHEFQMVGINRQLDETVETVFLMPGPRFLYLSSRLVRELAELSADISNFVSPVVEEALREKFNHGT